MNELLKPNENKNEKSEKRIRDFQFEFQKYLDLNPVVQGRFGDEYFSGDAASIYTLLSDNEELKPFLVKLGWGEVSKNTFVEESDETKKNSNKFFRPEDSVGKKIKSLPFPIYVVRQSDSYLISKEEFEKNQNDPENFLFNKAIFVFDKGNFIGALPKEGGSPYKISLQNTDLEKLPTYSLEDAEKFISEKLLKHE